MRCRPIVRYSSCYYHDNTAFRTKHHASPTCKTTEAALPYSKHLFDIHSCLAMYTVVDRLCIGVRANIHLGGRPSFARMVSVGGGSCRHFPGSIFCGGGGSSSRNFPGSIFMSTNCLNWGGGQLPPAPPPIPMRLWPQWIGTITQQPCYDVDKFIISVSHTLNIQCVIAFLQT